MLVTPVTNTPRTPLDWCQNHSLYHRSFSDFWHLHDASTNTTVATADFSFCVTMFAFQRSLLADAYAWQRR
jgi:hypothetical protein